MNSIGDVVVLVGINIDWIFNVENIDDISLLFFFVEDLVEMKWFLDDFFFFKKRVMKSEFYKLYIFNEMLFNVDSIFYVIIVILDLYLIIGVEKF